MQFEMIHREYQNISMQVTGIRVDHQTCSSLRPGQLGRLPHRGPEEGNRQPTGASSFQSCAQSLQRLSAEGHSLAFLRDPLAGAHSSAKRLARYSPWCFLALRSVESAASVALDSRCGYLYQFGPAFQSPDGFARQHA